MSKNVKWGGGVMAKYGIFISHRGEDWALAGRIYDFLKLRGYNPFIDAESLHQGHFGQELIEAINDTPFFLLLLTPNSFKNKRKKEVQQKRPSKNEKDWYLEEIKIAIEAEKNKKLKIYLISTTDFKWPNAPQEMQYIKRTFNCRHEIDDKTFLKNMDELVVEIDKDSNNSIANWREQIKFSSNVLVKSRGIIHKILATHNNCYGADFVKSVISKTKSDEKSRIKSIHMSCYAASLILSSGITMVDSKAYDGNILADIFERLLEDEEFYLEIIINAPGSIGAIDAQKNEKLGNNRLQEYPEAIFLSSYFNIQELVKTNDVFKKAYKERRFKFYVTENVMPYAIFQTEYKVGYEEFDNIKIDLYSEGIASTMERRTMLFFKKDDAENFDFFQRRYEYIRSKATPAMGVSNKEWLKEWKKIKKKINS